MPCRLPDHDAVAPRAGAWIETASAPAARDLDSVSPPARGRGLKLYDLPADDTTDVVAPRAGAWIETHRQRALPSPSCVAPRAGAWIETCLTVHSMSSQCASPPARGRGLKPIASDCMAATRSVSPPARGRGLKHVSHSAATAAIDVAPRAGAWIETLGCQS